MQAIVITFDRLATRLLGCYGNEWIETPHLDRLATQATLFTNCHADSVGPHAGDGWVTGEHSLRPRSNSLPLEELLRRHDVEFRVLDASAVRSNRWAVAGFGDPQRVEGRDGLEVSPSDVPIAKLVRAVGEVAKGRQREKSLIWLHAPEPGLPPEGFATLYFEDFEERGQKLDEIPRDEWAQQIAVAAGSMSLVDHWIGELFSQLTTASDKEPTLILMTAARGRSWIDSYLAAIPSRQGGFPVDRLRGQDVICPLIVAALNDPRQGSLTGLRCHRLISQASVFSTLLDWFEIPEEARAGSAASLLREAISTEPAQQAVYFGDESRDLGIRTADWNCLIRLNVADQSIPANLSYGDSNWPEQVQLFSKPEDIWDVTDLSPQQPEVCENLVRKIGGFLKSN